MEIQDAPPIIVGGIGGSGTRVVAEILMRLGVYMHQDLNDSLDCMSFTYLFKRPRWYTDTAQHHEAVIFRGLDILTRVMTTRYHPTLGDWRFLLRAYYDQTFIRREDPHLPGWGRQRLGKILKARGREVGLWGWKEPNTHIYLDRLIRYYPKMKYILVMRHGLDLAYSQNQSQFNNWSHLFGVTIPTEEALLPAARLSYWVRAHQRVMELGKTLGDERFLVIPFEALCAEPSVWVTRLADFVGYPIEDLTTLTSLVKTPDSIGRYREHDLSNFNADDLQLLHNFGFEL